MKKFTILQKENETPKTGKNNEELYRKIKEISNEVEGEKKKRHKDKKAKKVNFKIEF